MKENHGIKDEPTQNLQSCAIGVVLHPYLDDLERFLKHGHNPITAWHRRNGVVNV
jgi:hypothetical protein